MQSGGLFIHEDGNEIALRDPYAGIEHVKIPAKQSGKRADMAETMIQVPARRDNDTPPCRQRIPHPQISFLRIAYRLEGSVGINGLCVGDKLQMGRKHVGR